MENILKEEVEEYIDEEGIRVINRKIYIVVEDDKWKSQKNYYEKNKEQINTNIAEYRKKKYNEDEEFREKIKEKRREYYLKCKNKKKMEENKKLIL